MHGVGLERDKSIGELPPFINFFKVCFNDVKGSGVDVNTAIFEAIMKARGMDGNTKDDKE